MGNVEKTLKDFLAGERVVHDEAPGMNTVRFQYTGRNGSWVCYGRWNTANDQLNFFSVAPSKAISRLHDQALEFLTRVNYGLPVGNFEMNLEDGEIRFKTSVDVAGSQASEKLVAAAFYSNVVAFDRYLPGLAVVTSAKVDPRKLIRQLEGGETHVQTRV
jgi:hypothetical protein